MLKKTITYEDYNGNEVTEDFYFNLTKLEMLETDMNIGGFEDTLNKLKETEDAKEAYGLFKGIVLSSYGEKSEDGKRFIKSPELREAFEQSPALSELILEFLQNPAAGNAFVEGILPPKLIADVKAAEAEREKQKAETPELEAAEPQLAPEAESVELAPKKIEDYTREDLLAMPDEEFAKLAGTDPIKMPPHVLQVAFQRKNNDRIAKNDQQ